MFSLFFRWHRLEFQSLNDENGIHKCDDARTVLEWFGNLDFQLFWATSGPTISVFWKVEIFDFTSDENKIIVIVTKFRVHLKNEIGRRPFSRRDEQSRTRHDAPIVSQLLCRNFINLKLDKKT